MERAKWKVRTHSNEKFCENKIQTFSFFPSLFLSVCLSVCSPVHLCANPFPRPPPLAPRPSVIIAPPHGLVNVPYPMVKPTARLTMQATRPTPKPITWDSSTAAAFAVKGASAVVRIGSAAAAATLGVG